MGAVALSGCTGTAESPTAVPTGCITHRDPLYCLLPSKDQFDRQKSLGYTHPYVIVPDQHNIGIIPKGKQLGMTFYVTPEMPYEVRLCSVGFASFEGNTPPPGKSHVYAIVTLQYGQNLELDFGWLTVSGQQRAVIYHNLFTSSSTEKVVKANDVSIRVSLQRPNDETNEWKLSITCI